MRTELAARYLNEMAQAAEYDGENIFRVRALFNAAGKLRSLTEEMPEFCDCSVFENVPGIGKGILALLQDWNAGAFGALEAARASLPAGFAELIKVSGLGIKKIRQLNDELGITSLDELLAVARSGRLEQVKGFGAALSARIVRSAEDVVAYRGVYLLSDGLIFAAEVKSRLESKNLAVLLSGELRRTMELVREVAFVVEAHPDLQTIVAELFYGAEIFPEAESYTVRMPGRPELKLYVADRGHQSWRLLETTGPDTHVAALRNQAERKGLDFGWRQEGWLPRTEAEIYSSLGLPWVRPEMRDLEGWPAAGDLDESAVRGVLHVHSDYSDGRNSLEDMVIKARQMGYEWIGISDHSASAYYAGGLQVDDVFRQQAAIDALNAKYSDITILKGIESDILADGALDYPDEVLDSFDFVIASVHSRMDMDEKQMTARIIKAIEHPATTVLGHPTGRVLLARRAYQVDMEKVLSAAIDHGVVVELNANPQRLDLDWRLIPDFIAAGGRLSINPDAHVVSGMDDVIYGLMMAAKAGVDREDCINTWGAKQVMEFFKAG